MKDIYNYIDENIEEYVSDLQELIRKPSVSAQNIGLQDCAEFVKSQMHKDGLPAELHEIPGGPPLVFGHLKSSLSKKTLLQRNSKIFDLAVHNCKKFSKYWIKKEKEQKNYPFKSF